MMNKQVLEDLMKDEINEWFCYEFDLNDLKEKITEKYELENEDNLYVCQNLFQTFIDYMQNFINEL